MKKALNISTLLLLTTATISNAMDMTADRSASAAASANATSSSTASTQAIQLPRQGRAVLEVVGNPQNPLRYEMSHADALNQAVKLALENFATIQCLRRVDPCNLALERQVKARIEQQCGKGIIDQAFVNLAGKKDIPLPTFDALLAVGANINANPSGTTALLSAAEKGNAQLVRYLLKRGANLTITGSPAGMTPFAMALFFCPNFKTIQAFLEGGASINERCGMGNSQGTETVLTEAAAASGSTPAIIEYLIINGASVNQPNKEGKTPLMKAVNRGKADIAECLIRAGADVHARCSNGNTVLMHAVTPLFVDGNPDHHEAVVRLLLEHGAHTDISVPGKRPRYDGAPVTTFPILECIFHGFVNAARVLISAGADIHVIDSLNRTSLMLAASNVKFDLVTLLLENGAQSLVNHKDENGNTALHYAFSWNSPEQIIALLPILLKAGADPYARNNKNKALFDMIDSDIDPEVATYLDNLRRQSY